MSGEIRTGVSFRMSTEGLAPPAGLLSLQELFDNRVQMKLDADAEADPDRPVQARMTAHGLPGLRQARMKSNIDAALTRSRSMLSDGEDDVCLIVKTGGHLALDQRHRQSVARVGDGVLLVYREPAILRFREMNYSAIRVPFAALSPLAGNIETAAASCIRRETEALQLLRAYLASIPSRLADLQLGALVTTHVYDLMALAIGATGEVQDLISSRGVRAARLEAIKSAIFDDPNLGIDEIAKRQGITPRYVQLLFEEAGTTYSEFVLERRLEAAHAMLRSPRYARWSVTDIALEAGFGDLSYFNRRFKARFAATPSEVRAKALSAPGTNN